MPETQKRIALLRKAENISLNPRSHCLTTEEQLEVFDKARLPLVLRAPDNVFDDEEMKRLRKRQVQKIKDFIELLELYLVNEHGKCLIAVYSCE